MEPSKTEIEAAAKAIDNRWKGCPSTHCERAEECRSPHDCSARSFAARAALIAAAAAVSLTVGCEAQAHDFGCDGKPVPSWIKASCCGKADAHSFDSLRQDGDGDYHVEIHGHDVVLSEKLALPSQDACFWVFYNEALDKPAIYCFLVPLDL